MKEYLYYCDYIGSKLDPDGAQFSFKSDYDSCDYLECDWLAQEMADHYFHHHDGWENKDWANGEENMVFYVFDNTGKFLFAKIIEVETQPTFNSYEYEEAI